MSITNFVTSDPNEVSTIVYALRETFLFDGYEMLVKIVPETAPVVANLLVKLGEPDPRSES